MSCRDIINIRISSNPYLKIHMVRVILSSGLLVSRWFLVSWFSQRFEKILVSLNTLWLRQIYTVISPSKASPTQSHGLVRSVNLSRFSPTFMFVHSPLIADSLPLLKSLSLFSAHLAQIPWTLLVTSCWISRTEQFLYWQNWQYEVSETPSCYWPSAAPARALSSQRSEPRANLVQ